MASNRPRGHDIAAPGVSLAWMQAAAYGLGVYGFKTYTITPAGSRFFVYLYGIDCGGPLCILEANRLGQLRTGAASGVAASHMAREDASVVGVLGSGYQAGSQLEAIRCVRCISGARVYSPAIEHRTAYAEEMSQSLGIEVTPVDSAMRVVEGADILVTITSSATPVFDGAWLQPGTHITAVGGANAYVTELDDEAIQRSDVIVVDDAAQARIECGEFMIPAARGVLLWERVRELWQVVDGRTPGRGNPEDITLFKSLGMALWDVAVAKAVYDRAIDRGVGTTA